MASFWCESALLPDGWASRVRVIEVYGCIQHIAVGVTPSEADERLSVGLPGMPNLHSHAFQRGLAGLTEHRGPSSDSFWTWRELMYQFVDRVTPDQLEAITSMAYVEMLESGFTHVGEFHYLHHDCGGIPFSDPAELSGRVAAAAAATGIGLTLLPTFYAHSGFGGAEPHQRQLRFVNSRDRFADILEASKKLIKSLPGCALGVAPHSLRAVTPEELRWLIDLARGGLIHIHVAEQLQEVDDCVTWSGLRPVEWLLENSPLDRNWCLVHATHMTQGELRAVAESGAVVGLCPITEANLGDGIFRAADFVALAGNIGIGSDSNVLIDPAQELRSLEYSQRLVHCSRNVLASPTRRSTGRMLFERALSGGAQALRSSPGLVEGASLDLLSLDLGQPQLAQRIEDDILDSWIFSGSERLIDRVWRSGRKVVADGRHFAREAIVTGYRRALRQLLA